MKELEGTIVISRRTGKELLIVGCEEGMGISLAYPDEPGSVVACYVGKYSPTFIDSPGEGVRSDKLYAALIEQFKEGYYDENTMYDMAGVERQGFPTRSADDMCAFGR